MRQIADYIVSQDVDFVALQECDWATNRERAPFQNGVKFINELASGTGMFGVYGKTIKYSGGYYGIGVLSRYPIVKVERVYLPHAPQTEQRCMLVTELELPDERIVRFVSTHLEVSSSDLRLEQARFIDEYLKKDDIPTFLAGDMNSEPDSPEMQYFVQNGWRDLTNREFTFSVKKPYTKIDYIYYRGDTSLKVKDTVRDNCVKLSDHFPVIVKLDLKR